MGWLSDMLRGGADELGWDDLVRRTADAVLALRRYGARGESVFPPEIVVRITVGEGSITTVQELVERPALEREIAAALANRCDVPREQLPRCSFVVSAADRTTVSAAEGAPLAWQFTVEGGDRAGATLALPAGWAEAAFGRGPWHGADHGAPNDLVVCEHAAFVSRRAGRLYRAGAVLEVAALDQGDQLLVRRASGEVVRPARTARGRAVVRPGDAIELGDGREGAIRLRVGRGPG